MILHHLDPTIREDLLGRWVKFYQSVLTGPSPEAAIVARIAAADVRSSTADNNRLIGELTGLEASTASPRQVQLELRCRDQEMTEEEWVTAQELSRLLEHRATLHWQAADTTHITSPVS